MVGIGGGVTRYDPAAAAGLAVGPGKLAGGGVACADLKVLNSCRLTSSFLARAAAVSKVKVVSLEAVPLLRWESTLEDFSGFVPVARLKTRSVPAL